MMLKKFNVLSSYALTMTVTLFVALISGCDRREEVYPAEGNAYAQDPVYIAQLENQVQQRDSVRQELMKLNRELTELTKANGADITATTNTPRGRELVAAIRRASEQIVSNRFDTARIIRERHERAVRDSERIRRGEAKAIEISKKEEK